MRIFSEAHLRDIDNLLNKKPAPSKKVILDNKAVLAKMSKYLPKLLIGAGIITAIGYYWYEKKLYQQDHWLSMDYNLVGIRDQARKEAYHEIWNILIGKHKNTDLPLIVYNERMKILLDLMRNPVEIEPKFLSVEKSNRLNFYGAKFGVKQYCKQINKFGDIVETTDQCALEIFGFKFCNNKQSRVLYKRPQRYYLRKIYLFGLYHFDLNELNLLDSFQRIVTLLSYVAKVENIDQFRSTCHSLQEQFKKELCKYNI